MLLKKIIWIYYFIRGGLKYTNGYYVESLNYFNEAYKYYKDWNIVLHKALSEFFVKEYELATFSFQEALQLVEENKKLNIDEKNYLRRYILSYLLRLLDLYELYNNYEKYILMNKKSTYNKSNVRKFLLKSFYLEDEEN